MTEPERRRRRVRRTERAPETDPAADVETPRPPAAAPSVRAPAPTPAPPWLGSRRPDRFARPAASPEPSAATPPIFEPVADDPTVDDRDAERGLRGLVGAGSSQVSPGAAMRARDAARPTPDDLAAAQENLVIIRRGWIPRDPLTR